MANTDRRAILDWRTSNYLKFYIDLQIRGKVEQNIILINQFPKPAAYSCVDVVDLDRVKPFYNFYLF